MAISCEVKCLFNVILIGLWFVVDGQQLRHSPPTQHVLQCFSFERIELLSYTKMVNGMLKAANFEDIRNLHIACSRKRNCVKPPKNNRNWGWNVHYKCIDDSQMKNICETQADTLSSPVDIFYEGKSTTNAQNCRCIIIGNFRIFLVDARLLNVDNTCSRCYINIQMEDCDKEICLNETYSCPQEARYGVFYRKFVTPVPVNAKVAISVGQLNNASPQMIWYRIIPQGATEINCEPDNADTVTPISVKNEGSTGPSAASTDKIGDDGPNALVVAVPVLAVLLLVAACIIGVLLYRRKLKRSQTDKKGEEDGSAGETLSDNKIATNLSAVAKDVSDDSFLDNNQRLSVLNEYSTIQDINTDAGVLQTMDEGYYTIKDKEKNEYNVLSLNTPQIPKDPNYGRITEDGSDKLSNACSHLNDKEHVLKEDVSKDISSRPKLEVPVNGYHSKILVENMMQSTVTATLDPISKSPENTYTEEDHPDGYSHLVKDCKGASDSQIQGSSFKTQKQLGEIEIDNDAHGYFVLEQSKSNASTDDMISTPNGQYFVLEKMPFADKENSFSEQTMKRTGETQGKKPKKEIDDQEKNAESEYFEKQKNEQSPDQSHDYTTLENPVSNRKSIKASNDQSFAEKEPSQLEYFETKSADHKPGTVCDNIFLDEHTSIVKEEENQHDYFVLHKEA